VLASYHPSARVTKVVAEVFRTGPRNMRTTKVAFEVLRSTRAIAP
jgi:hypothetical protein